MKTKTCSKCGRELPIDQFHKAKSGIEGVRGDCKMCVSQYSKRYAIYNEETLRQKRDAYYAKNREKISKKAARKYATDKAYSDRAKQRSKERYKRIKDL